MKTVTNNFKEEIRKLGREIDFKIFLYANDKLITQNNNFIITQDNLNLVVEQFNQEEIEYTINSDEIYNVSVVNRGELLSTMMKEVDFEVSKELKVGDVISCEFGLKVGNSYEYVDYGKYMIYEKEFNEDTKTYNYIAYDRMLLTMREIPNPSNFENKNILSVIQEICTITNLEFNGTSQTALTYPNLNKVINQGTFTDLVMTYRDMLDMICQALGLSMVVEDNELVLKDINEKERTLVGRNSLYLKDVIEGNALGYSVDGVSEQNGTPTPSSPQQVKTIPSIRNLFNVKSYIESTNNGSFTVLDEDYVKFVNNTGNAFIVDFDNISVKSNTAYFLNTEVKNTGNGKRTYIFEQYSSNNTRIKTQYFRNNLNFITESNTAYVKIRLTTDNTNTQDDFTIRIQFEEGTVAHEYIPYGYWSRVKITGKNVCDGINKNIWISGSYDVVGIATGNSGLYIPVNSEKYTISTTETQTRYRVACTDIEPNSNSSIPAYNGVLYDNTNRTITINTTGHKYLVVNATDLTAIQIESGETATPYESYKEKEILIDMGIYENGVLTGHYELCSNKDKTVKDRLLVDTNGNCSITKYIGKRVFNGSETISLINSNTDNWYYKITTNNPTANQLTQLCSHYENKGIYNGNTDNGIMLTNNGLETRIRFGTQDTVNNYKNWLSNNNVTLQYELATPETITLPNTQIPLFEGINHITFVDDLETDTSVVYNSNNLAVEEIDETYLNDTNVRFGKKYGPINSVVLSRSEDYDTIYRRDEESIEKNGLCEYKIKDNPILLYNDREEYIDEIFNQLKGIEYYPNDYLSKGITFLDWLDFYNVKIGDNTYKCLMLNDEIKVEQGLEESVYSEIPEETVTDYKTSSKTDKEVSFIVDKQNSRIKGAVKQDDIIASLNVAIEDGQGIVELKGNSVTIESDNFTLDAEGDIVANSGLLGDIMIKDGEIYIPITVNYDYTLNDLDRIQQILSHQIEPTQEDYLKYDLDGTGTINSSDYIQIAKLIKFGITIENPGKILFKADKTKSRISIIGGNGLEFLRISFTGVFIDNQSGQTTQITQSGVYTKNTTTGNETNITPNSIILSDGINTKTITASN